MSYLVRLEVFEGPFDLLLDLIDKEKVDIWDIPIATITAGYLEYLHQMKQLDLAVSAEFLVMAATLLQIKAKMLLPPEPQLSDTLDDEEGEDPRDKLVEQLLTYKFYKEAARTLQEKGEGGFGVYPRGWQGENLPKVPVYTNPVGDLTLEDLVNLFEQVLEAACDQRKTTEIKRRVSVKERIGEIKTRLQEERRLAFSQLLDGAGVWDIIVTFLAVLELIKLREIRGKQGIDFGEIYIEALAWDKEVVS